MSAAVQGKAENGAIIRLEKVRKSFFRGKEQLDVLAGLDLTIQEGSFEALMGPSGSGKSTLLNLIAGLDQPTSGKLIVADEPTGDLDRTSADEIMKLLEKLNTEFGKTIVMVTHDPAAAERAKIVHRLDKGVLAA